MLPNSEELSGVVTETMRPTISERNVNEEYLYTLDSHVRCNELMGGAGNRSLVIPQPMSRIANFMVGRHCFKSTAPARFLLMLFHITGMDFRGSSS
jgi:hypothetical protein